MTLSAFEALRLSEIKTFGSQWSLDQIKQESFESVKRKEWPRFEALMELQPQWDPFFKKKN